MRDILMERRIRPVDGTGYMPMLDWIPMNVVEIPVEIVLIANLVLPKTMLPYRTLAMLGLGWIYPFRSLE